MRPVRRALLPAALLALLLLPSRVHAETIVITGGFLTSTGISNFGSFDLAGAGFRIIGSTDMGFVSPSECSPCGPGDVVNLFANLSGRIQLDAPALIDGASFSNLFDAAFFFEARSIVVPAEAQDFTVMRPFTFAGSLIALDETGQHNVFTRALGGRGMLTATFRAAPLFDDVRGFDFASIRYDFTAADPVPEPFTLLLVGSGLSGIVMRARRRAKL